MVLWWSGTQIGGELSLEGEVRFESWWNRRVVEAQFDPLTCLGRLFCPCCERGLIVLICYSYSFVYVPEVKACCKLTYQENRMRGQCLILMHMSRGSGK